MPNDSSHHMSASNVCKALVKGGLITRAKADEILKKEESLKRKLEKPGSPKRGSSGGVYGTSYPVTIIDVLASLNLTRADDGSKRLDEDAIYQVLAEAWGFSYRKIDPLKLDLNIVTTTIPRSFATKHLILPIAIQDEFMVVTTANPFNSEVIQDIERASRMRVKAEVSSKTDIIKLIDEFFGFKRSIAAAAHQFAAPTVDLGNLEQYVLLKSVDELPSADQHVVNAMTYLFKYAFDQRASDIHIEPKREESLIRMRIDGVLFTVHKLPKRIHSPLISRIKNMSRMDMAEKRRPQDGRIKTDKGDAEVEIRVSTVPVAFGEKVVMRIMDPDILFQDLDGLGFSSTDLIRFNRFITMPHGIILVCGPTGSGKSTTLYSTLRHLSTPEINITTVEDPIEMIHEEFNQIGVQTGIDVTFATILRNILRQDPDIIMIGEMRDLETAENAIQAALTGHLVLSTLHTNDAPSAITRLLELGLSGFLIQATLIGILGQRLVRKICSQCKESFEMDTGELENMGIKVGSGGMIQLHRGKGCHSCRGTGYHGRIGIFEVLRYSESMRKLTSLGVDMLKIKERARKEGMVTMRENAVKKLLDGVTTYQEVLRVTWEQH